MSIYRTPDQLSRFDPNLYSSLYDVNKRAEVKREPTIEVQTSYQDTIEISRNGIKKAALNRFKQTSKYIIAQNSFIRIGKYLFLAIAFPPYLIVYGLPKWIVVEAIPSLYSLITQIAFQAHSRIKNPVIKIIEKMALFAKKIEEFSYLLIRPMIHLISEIEKRMQKLFRVTQQRIEKLFSFSKKFSRLPSLNFTNIFKQVERLREKGVKQKEAMEKFLQKGLDWIRQSPQIFLNWSQLQLQQLSNRLITLAKPFQSSLQFADKASDFVFLQMKRGKDWIKEKITPLFSFFHNQVLPKWQICQKFLLKQQKRCRHFFHHKHQKALAFLQAKQERLKSLSAHNLVDRLISYPWMRRFPKAWQQWILRSLSHPLFYVLCQNILSFYSITLRYILGGMALALKAFSHISSLFVPLYQQMRNILTLVAQKIAQILNWASFFLRKCIKYTLYYFFLCLSIGAILCIWSIRYLESVMSIFISKIVKV